MIFRHVIKYSALLGRVHFYALIISWREVLMAYLLPIYTLVIVYILQSNRLKEGVRLGGIEELVGPHQSNQVLGFAEIDDVVGIAGQHVDRLNVLAADLKFQDLICAQLPLLDQPVAGDHDEELPFGVVPVLALGDAGLGNIDAYLTGIQRMNQLRKTTAVIHVHLEWEGGLLIREIREIRGVQFLGKATGWNLGDHQGLGLSSETLKQIHYFT